MIQVVIIDDDRTKLSPFIEKLKTETSFDVLGLSIPIRKGYLEQIKRADLLVIETCIEKEVSWELIERSKQVNENLRIIIHSREAPNMSLLLNNYKLINGFISKRAPFETFLQILKSVLSSSANEKHPSYAKLLGEVERIEGFFGLSKQQLEILKMLSQDQTAQEISVELGIAMSSVNTQIGRLYKKLGVSSRISAINFAIEIGMLAPPKN